MSREPVKSAVRVLEILHLFSREQRPLAQRELVAGLTYPQSSMTFLLKSMLEAGYLTYNRRTRLYFPTPEVLKLGNWLEEKSDYKSLFGQSIITELLHELKDLTEETVALSTQNDIHVHWHRMLESDLAVRLYIPEGKMYPLTCSSHGWMLLSGQPDLEVDKICRLINVRERNPERRVNLNEAIFNVARIRSQGYSYYRNAYLIGGCSVAMLLPVQISGQPVAIGVGGPVERIEEKLPDLISIMRETLAKYRAAIMEAFPVPALAA